MGDETPVGESAAAEALRAEVKDIATNTVNPRHVGYKKNDPGVARYLEGRYREVYGSGTVEMGDGLVAKGSKPNSVPADRPKEGEAPQAADAEIESATEEQLRAEWGDRFDENMVLARQTARELFPGPEGGALLERLAEGYFAAGGNEAEITKFLVNIGRSE